MGLFGKLKAALTKTKDGLAKKLGNLFSRDKIGEDFYEELEDILISSDVSVNTATEIVDEIRETAIKEKCRDKDYVTDLLK
ncbi:MAG: signal recognition particle receptor subunit alpha, partial [Clostridia bacterium]|nr:signal recognition particle receptor subunit alpha [Clostridia bacterium]